MSNAHWSQLQGDRNKSYFRPGGAEVVQADPGRVLCFAYGSALTPAFRESRGVNSLQIIPGRVSNFKLMFQHQGGYGTIDYRPNDTARPDVHGVVLEISSQDMERLGDREQGYMVQDVAVLAETGDLYISKAFMSHISWRLPQEVRPPAEYLNSLQQGARLHNLPMEYQAWLQRIAAGGQVGPGQLQ